MEVHLKCSVNKGKPPPQRKIPEFDLKREVETGMTESPVMKVEDKA